MAKLTAKFFREISKNPPANLDEVVHGLHEEVFAHTDCMECANCCKTTSPLLLQKDIERIAKALGRKPGEVLVEYIEMDEDGDFVFKVQPCPFLAADNSCKIYQDRPKACREYPHTNRKKFHQILDLTLKNEEICPAVAEIIEGMKERL